MNEVSKPCLKCGKLGIEKSAEILPDQGMLIQVIHDDGSKPCEFEEYASLSTFLTGRTKTKDPKIMECPVCGEDGRINPYRPNKNKEFHKWNYQIVHEPISGYWGKTKLKRRRRCNVKTEAHRRQILKSLGRTGHDLL